MSVRLRRRIVDIDSLPEFDDVVRIVGDGRVSMDGWRLRHVDLTGRTDVVLRLDPSGSLFLGCELETAALVYVKAGGGLVYPEAPGTPVDEYRGDLYTADELYGGLAEDGYRATLDARAYARSQRHSGDTGEIVVRALHDARIEAALDAEIAARSGRVVGVMGGHGVARGTDAFRDAAALGRELARAGLIVATGGGPGAMEAANLGAYLADADDADVEKALSTLAAVPSFQPSIREWAAGALEVRRRWPDGDGGIGVPTWFYGHEPPNAFAGVIAKFFQNSVREATLLNRCTGGIVFLPGAAGTVQEIFQDACENYYASDDLVAPMVLVGERHWTEELPAWPLLHALAADRHFERVIALVDSGADAAEFIAEAAG